MTTSELLYDHYKDTCQVIRDQIKQRNQLFIYVVLIISTQFIFMLSPNSVLNIFSLWIDKNYTLKIDFSLNMVQSILWLFMLYITIRYIQETINIEQGYTYIHSLENKLNNLEICIDREGKNYLTDYPIVKNIIHYIYQLVFPLIYILLVLIEIIKELTGSIENANLLFDVSIGILCLIIQIFYLQFLFKKGN